MAKGDNVIFTAGKNTLTVKNALNKEITYLDADGNELTTIVGGVKNETFDNDSSKSVTLATDTDIGDAAVRTAAIRIVSNSLDNTILGGSNKDTLYGGSGNDYVVGGAGSDKIYGQDGNDTLWGGAGNDTLKGGDGDDTYLYNAGEGKDVIIGFDDTDMLQITTDTFSALLNATGNIVFKVNLTANAITLKNFTAETFNINGDSYKISGNKLVKTSND